MAITQVSNSLVKQDLTIVGGTVDNTVIGSGTPAAGTFTTVAGALASTVTGTTAAASDNSTKIATTAYVTTALANLVDSAPGTLNTLNELAAALGDDASFSTTVTTSIAAKLPLAGGTMTGNIAHASAFTLDVGGSITLDSDSGVIDFDDGGTNIGRIENASSDFKFESRVQDKDIVLVGNDGGVGVEALRLDMSAAGRALFNAGSTFGDAVTISGGNPALVLSNSGDAKVNFVRSSNTINYAMSSAASGGHGFYDNAGSEYDLYMKAGKVGIGTTSPAHALDVLSTTSGTSRTIRVAATASSGDNDATMIISNGGSGDAMLRFDYEGSNTDRARIGVSSSAQQLEFFTAGNNERMRIDSSGNLALMTDGAEFRLYYTEPRKFISNNGASVTIKQIDNNATNAYIDFASWTNSSLMRIMNSGNVGIGTTSPGNYYANHLVVDIGSAVQSGITIVSDTNREGMFAFADGTSGNQRYRGFINYDHANDRMAIGTSGDSVIKIESDGDVGINGGGNLTGDHGQLTLHGRTTDSIATLNLNGARTTNSVTNAINFAQSGTVAAEIKTTRQASSNAAASLSFHTSGSERMKIFDGGAITMASQPAFLVQPSSNQNNFALSGVTVLFGTERFDQANNFSNNEFTAPVTGRYQFNVHLRIEAVQSNAVYYQVKLSTSNKTYVFTLDPASNRNYHSFAFSVLADMDANDTANVIIHQAGGTQASDVETESHWSGYLVA